MRVVVGGFALYFFNFSTFLTRRGLYLEDTFVVENPRGQRLWSGHDGFLAKTAFDEGCGRFDSSVLIGISRQVNFIRRGWRMM